ncbi:UNVERIFIED_ORG: helix-turn-helix domain-containing protein [Roseateles sp. XES5]|nr:helix-turn-helix domain-containing protein [Roseateles sp. XES5]
MTVRSKMVGISISVTEKAKQNLDRQARERGIGLSLWAGQLFDAAFASVCAREKSMPISDGDLDAIVGATLLLRARERWDTATIAQALGVSEPTVVRILDCWREYRAGMEANDKLAARLQEALTK